MNNIETAPYLQHYLKANTMPGKVLLFGEYSVLYGSKALVTPFETYKGKLKLGGQNSYSHGELIKLYNYLVSEKMVELDIERLAKDLARGLYFDSDIPVGQGLGSSAALTAAIIDEYLLVKEKDLFGKVESFFHGKSSGFDPKVCYQKKPLVKIGSGDIKEVGINYERAYPSYLISTGKSRKVSDCLSLFKQELAAVGVEDKFNSEYVSLNNACINEYLNMSGEFWEKVEKLSKFQFDHFQSLICSSVKEIWRKGLESKDFFVKLCGAGGGGHYLVFVKNKNYPVPTDWIKVEMETCP